MLQRFILKLAQARAGNAGRLISKRWPVLQAFLAVHRMSIGAALEGLAYWSSKEGCPLVLGELDVPALLHLSCPTISAICAIVGAAFLGAGGFSADDVVRAGKRDEAIANGKATCIEPDKAIVMPLPDPLPPPHEGGNPLQNR